MIVLLKLVALLLGTQTITERDFLLVTTRPETLKDTKSTSVESQRQVVKMEEILTTQHSAALMSLSIPIKSTEILTTFRKALLSQ